MDGENSTEGMSGSSARPPDTSRMSGAEIADSALNKAGAAASGLGRGLIILYAAVLIIVGVIAIFLPGAELAVRGGGVLFVGYGIYLLLGGGWVIY